MLWNKSNYKSQLQLCLDSCFEEDTDFYGNDVGHQHNIKNPKACQTLCQNNSDCNFWTYSGFRCYLKSADSERRPYPGAISGPKFPISNMGARSCMYHQNSKAIAIILGEAIARR